MSALTNLNIGVIIPAAGSGSRVAASPPKQFVKVDGFPLFYYTIDAFIRLNLNLSIVFVCSPDYISFVANELKSYFPDQVNNGYIIVSGGSQTRHRSISSAISVFNDRPVKPDLVIIHDGVRPILDQSLLTQLIESAHQYGGSGPVCDLVSTTLKINSQGFVDSVLNRSEYKQSEMPQVFRFEIIKQAYLNASYEDMQDGTECIDLVRKYTNAVVKFVPGVASQLFKVTYKKDLYAIEGLMKEQRVVKLIPMTTETDDSVVLLQKIENELKKRFKRLSIENFRPGFEQYAPNESLVFIYFADRWSNVETEQTVRNTERRQFNRIHLILLANPLTDIEYAEIVKKYRESYDNYIIAPIFNSDCDKILQFLANILWSCDHFNGQVHFL